MKKILFLIVIALFLFVKIDGNCGTPTRLYYDNKTGTGQAWGTAISYSNWTCDILTTDNTTTAITMTLQGSQCTAMTCSAAELTKFSPTGMATYSLTASELGAGIGSFTVVAMPVQRLRVILTTLTGGTNPYVTVRCTGAKQ